MEPDNREDSEIWTLDAHCDTLYMRVFLGGERAPEELRGVDPEDFFRVTLPRLKEGRVGCLFLNVGDMASHKLRHHRLPVHGGVGRGGRGVGLP